MSDKKITVSMDQLNRIVERKVAKKLTEAKNVNKKQLKESAKKTKVAKKPRVIRLTESQLVDKIEKIVHEYNASQKGE